MEVKASSTYLKIGPRKLRLLTVGLVGLSTKAALVKVEGYSQKGKEYLEKVLKQAVANAVNNFKLDEDLLIVKEILTNEGPRLKRQDASHGARFDRGVIAKRMSHLSVVVGTRELPMATKVSEDNKKETKTTIAVKSKNAKEEKSIKKTKGAK